MKEQLIIIVDDKFQALRDDLENIDTLFHNATEVLQDGRNTIKVLELGEQRMAVKSFKRLGRLRGFIYRRFRKSKAQRSFEHGKQIIASGFSTPAPVAYIEKRTALGITDSYYISLYLPYDFSIREALTKKIAEHEEVVEQFVSFTYQLHNAGILHLDHSPGNTLVEKTDEGYQFSLIDINRLEFRNCDLATRLDNLARLTQDTATIKNIAFRYAALAGENPDECFARVGSKTTSHFKKLALRRGLKKRVRQLKDKKSL